MPPESEGQKTDRKLGANWLVKLVIFATISVLAATAYYRYGNQISLSNLASQEAQLKAFQNAQPWLVYGTAFAVYVGLTSVSLPGAAGLSLVYGWYFGFLPAVVLVSFASTAGATLAFLMSRFLFRDAIQKRFGGRLEKFNLALQRDGALYLFTLRLIPAVPFFVINSVMGLTPLRLRTFWWVSQLGMLPGTIVYVYAGSRVPNLGTLADKGARSIFTPTQWGQILFAFALLGTFPLVVRFALKGLPRRSAT